MAINIQETDAAKSILVKSRLPKTDYVINAYTGCVHGCQYCYANFITRFTGHSEDWGQFCDVKINAPQILAKEMVKAKPGNIMMSSVTDPYNPLENKYKLTRQILEILLKHQWPLTILTKSSLIVRDIDLLKEFKNIKVGFSFFSVNDKDIKNFEMQSSPASDRLKVMQQLKTNGLETFAFVAPILPYISDLRAIFRALDKIGPSFVYCDSFNYRTGSRQKAVLDIVEAKYPDIWPKFAQAYKNPKYWQQTAKFTRNLANHYGLETQLFF